MSRRNRDYSIGARPGRYHRVGEDEPLWVKAVAGGVAAGIMAVISFACEELGDAWVRRNDIAEYSNESQRNQAAAHAGGVIATGLAVHLTRASLGPEDIPPLVDSAQKSGFKKLANASMAGGQPADSASYLPHTYDLEWGGVPGKNNSNAPKEYCIDVQLPEESQGAYVWQINGERASAELSQTPEGFIVKVCHFGKDNTPNHHDVAIMAAQPGSS